MIIKMLSNKHFGFNELSDQIDSAFSTIGTVNSLSFCWNDNSFELRFYL